MMEAGERDEDTGKLLYFNQYLKDQTDIGTRKKRLESLTI
jgi:hypothetical protein